MRGSSPLARGLPADNSDQPPQNRIIPARAGFTRSFAASPQSSAGSSPLARGLPCFLLTHALSIGIIPARAGFTAASARPRAAGRDHPRSRGVYVIDPMRSVTPGGSSPLARGLRRPDPPIRRRRRIIPARAGFTSLASQFPPFSADHPRSRGVYGLCLLSSSSNRGSSPLARGLPGDDPAPAECGGIIPARAGFTLPVVLDPGAPKDHPRSRGVYGLLSR